MMNSRSALPLCLLLAACAPIGAREHVDRGNICLNEGKAVEALEHFDSAISKLKSNERDLRLDASMGKCEALAAVDPTRCSKEFMQLAEKAELDSSAYNRVAIALYNKANFEEALTVLEHGNKRLPEEASLGPLIQKVGIALESKEQSNDANEAMTKAFAKRLESLGYIGNTDRKR